MAVKVLKDNLTIKTPNNTSGNNPIVEWTYKISVDDNDQYIVEITSAKGKNGVTVGSNLPSIWKNDGYTPTAKLLESSGLTASVLNASVYQELQKVAKANSRANSKPLPSWAKTTGLPNAEPPGQSANNTPPDPATAAQQQTAQQTSSGSGNIFDLIRKAPEETKKIIDQINSALAAITNPTDAIQKILDNGGFGGDNGGNYPNAEPLVYPVELKGAPHLNKADVLLIEQFEYVPANKDDFFTNERNIFQQGLSGDPDARFNKVSVVGGSVTLPMPQSFEEKKGVQYGEDTMNTLAAGLTADVLQNMGGKTGYMAAALGGAAVGGLTGFLSGKAPGFSLGGFSGMAKFAIGARALSSAATMAGNDSGQALLSTTVSSLMLKAAGMNVSAETILARGAGIVPNPNMELLFRSPELRNFGFAYRLTARSKTEAEEIRKIIRYFKQGMSPKRQGGDTNYFLKTPNMFRVQFRTVDKKRNKGMPKFKTCALRGFTTDYSPDKMWAAYEDGQPVSVNIVMEFGELTPIYANDYNMTDFETQSGSITKKFTPLDDIGY